MKIPVILNTKKTVLDAAPDEKLLTVLRRYKLFSVKIGCTEGYCGACTVLLNGRPVPSCKIPVSIIRDERIITLEYFETTEDYDDIRRGFEKANVKLCGYCNAGKIFSAWSFFKLSRPPNREEIYKEIENLSACCVDSDTLVNGILYALTFRATRIRTRKDAKK